MTESGGRSGGSLRPVNVIGGLFSVSCKCRSILALLAPRPWFRLGFGHAVVADRIAARGSLPQQSITDLAILPSTLMPGRTSKPKEFDGSRVQMMLDEGWTIVLNHIETIWEPLRRLKTRLQREIRLRVGCSMCVSYCIRSQPIFGVAALISAGT